jgi:transposase
VAERTRTQNRLRWHLHELDPDLQVPTGALDRVVWLDRITQRLQQQPATLLVGIAAELVERCRALTARINQLAGQLAKRVAVQAPQLLAMAGCGPLSAAELLVETAGADRFRSEAAFAMHAGVAPIPASSGNTQRHRLNRGGNRQLNAALHRIAVTQLRVHAEAQAFIQRRVAGGDSGTEALRALKRLLARRVFRLLRDAHPGRHQPDLAAA